MAREDFGGNMWLYVSGGFRYCEVRLAFIEPLSGAERKRDGESERKCDREQMEDSPGAEAVRLSHCSYRGAGTVRKIGWKRERWTERLC